MITTRDRMPLRDVLYAFSLAKEVPDIELLDEFVRRYPEFASEITDFAVETAIDAIGGDVGAEMEESTPMLSPSVSRAMSRFQNRLFELRQKKQRDSANSAISRSSVENPFSRLDREAFRDFANRLGANTLFVVKLRDRQIDPNTISVGFEKRIADELSVPLDLIASHFSARAESQAGQFYKSEQKPTAEIRQSFQEAVRTCGLTTEQQRHLLDL